MVQDTSSVDNLSGHNHDPPSLSPSLPPCLPRDDVGNDVPWLRPPLSDTRVRREGRREGVCEGGREEGRKREREMKCELECLFVRLSIPLTRLIHTNAVLFSSLSSLPLYLRGNIRMAFLAIAFVFLTHCFLHCRDSVLIRPHPGVWRLVHGIGMLYLMCLGVLLGEEEGRNRGRGGKSDEVRQKKDSDPHSPLSSCPPSPFRPS